MAPKTNQMVEEITIEPLKRATITVKIIGMTPLYVHALSAQAKRTLLLGGKRKTTAEKAEIKHNPLQEYRESWYLKQDGPTLMGFPASALKCAMATAALETPGTTKTSVWRNIFIKANRVAIWGKPYLKCDIVRQAGINATPDVRFRPYLPRWAAEVNVSYLVPALSAFSVMSLMSNAGIVAGIGDFRQEKGRGSFGTFRVFGDDLGDMADEWDSILTEGRDVQQAAYDDPEPADDETADLLAMVADERARRANPDAGAKLVA